MGVFIARRLLTNLLVFSLVSVGIFALVRAAPGDPVQMMVNPEQIQLGGDQFIAAKREQLGLDRPLPVQYAIWLRHAVTGDLGVSYVSGKPVTAALGERLGPTVELMGVALVVALLIAVPLGVVAALKKNTLVDYLTAVLSLGTVSIPTFFLGIAAIYVFALKLRLLPSAGMSTPGQEGIVDSLRHLVMPVLILGLGTAGPFTRYVRSGLLGELNADYVRTAEAKGASRVRTVLRHGLRNALIPLITVLTMSIPALLAGAVVVEQIFAWPGMGQLALSSINQQDYPVVVGFALYIAVLVLVCNLLADILYAAVDPRVKLA